MENESKEINPVQPVQPAQKKSSLFDTLRFILISVLLVLGFRHFIAQPFIVSGDSMVQTFKNGEYLIVDELSYRLIDPSRGDVIIMRYPLDPGKFFIKRVIGLPGETITFEGLRVTISTVENKKIVLAEPYIQNVREESLTTTLGQNEYYVLGDNRGGSFDSRRWGALQREEIVGRPIVRLLPLSRLSWMPGAYTEAQ